MKKLFTPIISAALVAICSFSAWAEAPQGYYNSLVGKKEGDLKTAIYQLVHNFTTVSSYSALPQYFQRTDVYPESRRWWDMYSDIPLYAPSFSGLNREHSFPKSWWKVGESVEYTTAYVDLNHLYPSEAKANQAKSNYPLGTVATTVTPKFDNGVVKVGNPMTGQGGGSQLVFEPADEYKGDFARTYFYMVTCYQDLQWNTKYTWMMGRDIYPTLKGWAIDLLLKWHRDDPVSDKETNRNDVVYTIQNNRNPFIDRPELAEYIWGNKKGEAYTGQGDTPTGDPVLISPVEGTSLDFGEVAIGKSVTSKLLVRGENIRNAVQVMISKRTGNGDMFSIPVSSIAASLVNNSEGYWLNVTYTPTAEGEHTGRLVFSDYDNTGASFGIELRGKCFPVPTLTACTATDATDITSDSYVANWTYPENEVIDYWVVNRTKYSGGSMSTEQLVAEGPGLLIDGFGESDKESYTVQSYRLGYLSPESNVIFVDHLGITGIEAEHGLVVQGFDGMIRFLCSDVHTGVCIYDVSGKMVMFLDSVSDNSEVEIPAGIYFITTDQAPRPVKVAVQ